MCVIRSHPPPLSDTHQSLVEYSPIPTIWNKNTQTTMSCPCCRRWCHPVGIIKSTKVVFLEFTDVVCEWTLLTLIHIRFLLRVSNTLSKSVREQCVLQTYFTDLHRNFKSVTITVEWWTITPRVKSLPGYFSGWAMVFFAVITFHEVLISLVFDLLSQTLVWSRYSCVLPWLVDFRLRVVTMRQK